MPPKPDPGVDELFAGIDNPDENTSSGSDPAGSQKTPGSTEGGEDDPLAGLEAQLKAPHPTSRPNTPKIASSATSRNRSPKRGGAVTPSSTASARTSEDKARVPRKSGESTRLPTSKEEEGEKILQAPPAPEPQQSGGGGGGWWGGIFATASAAVKQAESAYKEIQKNEDAQKWADQLRGNVGALRGLGDELRSRAIPTFTGIMNAIAPPISQHERLQIHITHDLVGYPSLDPMIYATFSRVMSQVEGGDLMVIQRGSESQQRRASDAGYRGSGGSGWSDGPWWRSNDVKRDIGSVKGLTEGTKLARVSAETYANEFFASRGGVEEAAKQATQNLSESNPVRSSDIFLALQPISHTTPEELFGGPPEEKKEGGVEDPKEADEVLSFAVYLHDPIHGITFSTLSQAFPQKWAEWLDARSVEYAIEGEPQLPEEIMEIIHSGGVDPREWVAEWVEEAISLAVGVLAQRYVARRMGVGEGGLGRGKARQEAVDAGAGELARAGAF